MASLWCNKLHLYIGNVCHVCLFLLHSNRYVLRIGIGVATLMFFATNVSCAIIVKQHQQGSSSVPVFVSIARVLINDSLFIVLGVALAVFLYKLSKMSSSNVLLEAKVSTYLRDFPCQFK